MKRSSATVHWSTVSRASSAVTTAPPSPVNTTSYRQSSSRATGIVTSSMGRQMPHETGSGPRYAAVAVHNADNLSWSVSTGLSTGGLTSTVDFFNKHVKGA